MISRFESYQPFGRGEESHSRRALGHRFHDDSTITQEFQEKHLGKLLKDFFFAHVAK